MTLCLSVRRGVAMLATLALAGCTATTARTMGTSDGEGVVGVSLPTSDDLAWERLGTALDHELRSRGYRVDLQFAAGDDRTQAAQVRNMLTKSEDAVVLVPLPGDGLGDAVAAADEARVPLIPAGRGLDAEDALVAVDPAAVGRAQARALLAALPDATSTEATTVALLAGAADDPDAAARHAAAIEVLASAVASRSLRIVAGADLDDAAVADSVEHVEDAAEESARDLLDTAGDDAPRMIVALGDAVSRGVVAASTTPDAEPTASPSPPASTIPEKDARPAPRVIASGGDAAVVRALRDGIVAATVFVDTRSWAVAIADAVAEALAGGVPVPTPSSAPATVTRDEVRAVFLDGGWLRPEDL
ncbi:substrate-binding domain-containing protein [Microbacterium sp. RURRCA19A]|uniref:substrate-binding domain-containing protein n=1 Tax=Microbacterium sp. RURRCA19A TaxID=1907391 RepID=UPI0009562E51|nr:substrate-binding domain-containing protein [Microbacterium sp. RURRCA19A]SIS08179.1 ABC-type xylose transport system, substrate-binding protein [Microbacterium sp. RURRCA19A]